VAEPIVKAPSHVKVKPLVECFRTDHVTRDVSLNMEICAPPSTIAMMGAFTDPYFSLRVLEFMDSMGIKNLQYMTGETITWRVLKSRE